MVRQRPATKGQKKRQKDIEEQGGYINVSGYGGTPIFEEEYPYYELPNETVIKGINDSYIVLGRDRPSGITSGYGGIGYPRASSIDIVVGRSSDLFEKENLITEQSGFWLNPNFSSDAARIHISQKTDIDDNFSLPETIHGKGIGNSAIGMKADNIRIMARQAIKLISSVSRTDSNNLSITGAGVELIAIDPEIDIEDFNRSVEPPVMQPIPKGNNLENAIEEILNLFDVVTGLLLKYVELQTDLNHYFASHTHLETFFGNQGIPSIDVQSPLYQNNMEVLKSVNFAILEFKKELANYYSTFISSNSKKYINSAYHYLN